MLLLLVLLLLLLQNTAPAQVAIEIGAKGPNHGAVSACATSGHAIGAALRLLQVLHISNYIFCFSFLQSGA